VEAARILSLAAASSDFGALTAGDQALWRDFVLDTLAVMAAGAAHPSVSAARGAMAVSGCAGPASVIGLARVLLRERLPLPTAWR
jgi:2-methylcitrate dehydratase PrpD